MTVLSECNLNRAEQQAVLDVNASDFDFISAIFDNDMPVATGWNDDLDSPTTSGDTALTHDQEPSYQEILDFQATADAAFSSDLASVLGSISGAGDVSSHLDNSSNGIVMELPYDISANVPAPPAPRVVMPTHQRTGSASISSSKRDTVDKIVPSLPPPLPGMVVNHSTTKAAAAILLDKISNMESCSDASVAVLPARDINEHDGRDPQVEVIVGGKRRKRNVPVSKSLGGQKRRRLPVGLPLTRQLVQFQEHELTPELMRSVMKGYIHMFSKADKQEMVKIAYQATQNKTDFIEQISNMRMMWKEQVHREHGFQVMPVDDRTGGRYWENHTVFTCYYRSIWHMEEFRMLRFQLDASFFSIWEKEESNCSTMTDQQMKDFLRDALADWMMDDMVELRGHLRAKYVDNPLGYHHALTNAYIPRLFQYMAGRGDTAPTIKELNNISLQCMLSKDPEVIELSSFCLWNPETFF